MKQPLYYLLFAIIFSVSLSAQTEFPLSSSETRDHQFADFNGDGILDILSLTGFNGEIEYFQGLGGGAYALPVSSGSSGVIEPMGIDIGDLDGDGDLDITAIVSESGLRVFLNDGMGSFTQHIAGSVSFSDPFFSDLNVAPFAGFCGNSDIVLLDRNEDGNLDATFLLQSCVGLNTEGLSFILLGEGDGSFDTNNILFSYYLPMVPLGTGSAVHDIQSFDFNGTGFEEVLVLQNTGGQPAQDILTTHGEGWGYFEQSYGLTFPAARHMRAYDFDNDGDQELFIASPSLLTGYTNLGGFGPLDQDSISFIRNGLNTIVDFDVADFDGDGRMDYMVLQNNGDGADLFLDDGTGEYIMLNGTWYDTSEGYSSCRFFQDGATTRLLLTSFAGTWIYTLDFVGSASGHVYLDLDGDELYSPSDYILPNIPLEFQSELFLYSGSDGFEQLYGEEGEQTISLGGYDENLFTAFDPTSYTFNLDGNTPSAEGLYLGLAPNGVQENLLVTLNAQTARCDLVRNHTLSMFSQSNVPIDGQVAYTVDELCAIVDAPEADSIVGNTAYFSFEDAFMLQSWNPVVQVQIPDTDFIGDTLAHTWEGSFGTEGIVSGSLEQIISCGYDPNDKQEFTGTTSYGFIEEDAEYLDYLIRFQNTGNDTAYTVILDDPLDAALDPLSILVTGHSHDYQLLIDPFDKAVFIFEDILLPDSMTDVEASQGFVRFRIDIQSELVPGDSIANMANIFFDTNPPIATNTVYNTVFSCDIFGIQPLIDDSEEMSLSVQNQFQSIEWTIDGQAIPDAVGNTIDLAQLEESGFIVVTTTDSLGCVFSSEPYAYSPASVNSLQAWGISTRPNPTDGEYIIEAADIDGRWLYELYSAQGQRMVIGNLNQGQNKIDLYPYAAGLYIMVVHSPGGEGRSHRLIKH